MLRRPDIQPDSSPNEAYPFIDHLREIWNFCRDRPISRGPLLHEKGEAMQKTLMALVAVGALAVSACGAGTRPCAAGRAAGVAAGLIGGAIVGGAIASQNAITAPAIAPAPITAVTTRTVWQRQRFWDGYGWRVRSVRVCD
jgi:hypothetical protein